MAETCLEVARLTMDEFRERVAEGRWLILPSGTCEEHGPHLPLGSDTLEAEFLARAVAEQAGALVAPALAYGACTTTRHFPGTIDLRLDTVEALAHDVIRGFTAHGCRKVLVLSGHAGKSHLVALRQAALRAVEAVPGLRVLVLCVTEVPAPAHPGPDDVTYDGHAASYETALVLAMEPSLVRQDRIPAGGGRPAFPPFEVLAHPERYFPTGVMGNPSCASAEAGKRAAAHLVERIAALLTEGTPA
jgi:creatinine amidohydrolase